MNKLKGALKSKTAFFSAALVIFGTAEANLHFVQAFLKPEHFGLAVAVIGGITGVLRALTDKPLEDK